jgi:hypothetical protein
MRNPIFWPMIAQAALVAAVWVWMYVVRIGEIRRRRIDPQSIADSRKGATLEDVTPADNLRNLFELPVLFFAVCLALAITDQVTTVQLALAWLYVGLRALHSLIHVTYNRVMHRFAVHAASTLVVFAMWGLFAASLASQ